MASACVMSSTSSGGSGSAPRGRGWAMCRPAEGTRPGWRATATSAPGGGFSLLELLMALVVLGLLAALALPSYQSQIRKTRRADALAGILAVQQAQERLRARLPDYAASLGGGGGLGLAERSPA